uniref:Inositol 1,3,4-trisphosphate 5/6-kinase n=1 Tax=Aotus nancymaae TaxID=37293 RepID=A0A2K5EIW5_AOTNA
MQTFQKGKRVGYWLSEKKIKKLNFQALAEQWIEVIQLNLSQPVVEQGPLDVIIHKLNVILEVDQNDSQYLELVQRFQEYIDAHPETIILDPFPDIRTLLDNSKSCKLIWKIEVYMEDDRICSLPFMEVTSLCRDDTMCGNGTNSHEMAIGFNQEGLNGIQPPCVVQNFINHNTVLYKVFVVGESYTMVQRPLLKNFSMAGVIIRPDGPSNEVIRELSRALQQAIDIVINNQMGQHAIIDMNAFPGYEGMSEFFTDFQNHIAEVLQVQSTAMAATGYVAPLRHSKLLAKPEGSLAGKRTCSTSPGCCSNMIGQDAPWKTEADAGGTAKMPHQKLSCTTRVLPSFQQHCVASLATKASSSSHGARIQRDSAGHTAHPLGQQLPMAMLLLRIPNDLIFKKFFTCFSDVMI